VITPSNTDGQRLEGRLREACANIPVNGLLGACAHCNILIFATQLLRMTDAFGACPGNNRVLAHCARCPYGSFLALFARAGLIGKGSSGSIPPVS
jgi:hypothetical protein